MQNPSNIATKNVTNKIYGNEKCYQLPNSSEPFNIYEEIVEENLKDKIYQYIKSNPQCSFSELLECFNLKDSELDSAIQSLKNERAIFEPKADKLMVLE